MTGAVRSTSAPTPSATIDSPRARMMTRLCRSAKCAGHQSPSADRRRAPAAPSRARSRPPRAPPARRRRRTTAPDEQADHDGGARRESEDPAAERRVVAAGQQEQRDVPDPHHAVGDGERERAVAERLRDAERDDEQAGHRAEHHDPDRALLGIDDARQPRVAHPRPPEHARARASRARCPTQVGWAAISAVHCVNPSTKTRSKKSSSGLTVSRSA